MDYNNLDVGAYVRYQIKDALDHGLGSGTITKVTMGHIDGATRKYYVVQDDRRRNVSPAVLPNEILEVIE